MADFLEILSIVSRFFVQRHEAKAERREIFIFASGVAELLKKTWQNQEASQILLLPESLFKFYGNGKQLILYFLLPVWRNYHRQYKKKAETWGLCFR